MNATGLPVSSCFRICDECGAGIDPGRRYAINLNGFVVCDGCVTPQDLMQYEQPESAWLDDRDWNDDWDEDDE